MMEPVSLNPPMVNVWIIPLEAYVQPTRDTQVTEACATTVLVATVLVAIGSQQKIDSTKVINKSELGAVLFPKNEGSGEEDYLGAYKSVQLTESSASGVTKQKQLYENCE